MGGGAVAILQRISSDRFIQCVSQRKERHKLLAGESEPSVAMIECVVSLVVDIRHQSDLAMLREPS